MPHFTASLALCDGPHSVCGVCFSLNLRKSISYLSLSLSLNSFWDETSRIWTSLGPETRYRGFWLGLSPSHVGSSPKLGFGWVWGPAHEFKSQSEVNGFICIINTSESGCVKDWAGEIPILRIFTSPKSVRAWSRKTEKQGWTAEISIFLRLPLSKNKNHK